MPDDALRAWVRKAHRAPLATTRTTADGRFTLEAPEGASLLVTHPTGNAALEVATASPLRITLQRAATVRVRFQTFSNAVEARVEGGIATREFTPRTELMLPLEPAAWLEVEVVDERSGSPLAGAEVTAVLPEGVSSRRVFDEVAPGRHRRQLTETTWLVQARAEGYFASGRAVVVAPGERKLTLELTPAELLTVRVIDARGAPVNAQVSVAGATGQTNETLTLPAGKHLLRVWHFAAASHTEVAFELPRTQPLVVTLSGGAISLLVRRPNGDPAPDAYVEVKDLNEAHDSLHMLSHLEADADGVLHLGPLEPGLYRIKAAADGFRPALPVTVRVDARLVPIAVKLRPALSVRGVMVDAAGRPLPGARVRRAARARRAATGGAHGRRGPIRGRGAPGRRARTLPCSRPAASSSASSFSHSS